MAPTYTRQVMNPQLRNLYRPPSVSNKTSHINKREICASHSTSCGPHRIITICIMVVAAILILCAVCLLVRRHYKRKQTKKRKEKRSVKNRPVQDDAPSTTNTPTEKSKKEAGRDARGNKMSNYQYAMPKSPNKTTSPKQHRTH
jgi:ribosome-binding protein aMBF1 (putative translation factor)